MTTNADNNFIPISEKLTMYEAKYYEAIFQCNEEGADKYYQKIKHCEKLLKEGEKYEPPQY